MLTDMHMQMLEVVSFELTNLISFMIKNLGPGAHKLMWDNWFNRFVASISTTVSSDVAITKMMLCSNHISKNCRAKWALVSNHHHVNIVSKVTSRQF